MTVSFSRRHAKRRWALLAVLVTVGLGVSIGAVSATLTGTTFSGDDGNLSVQGAKDWNSFKDGSTAGVAANFAQKADEGFAYAGGMKHDEECPALVGEGTLNKSDFTKFYIAYEELGGDTFLYLAWQRIPQNTDTNSAHASFIFAQADLEDALCANGVTPERTEGDMLVTYDFTGGSTGNATIGLSRWVTDGAASQCETSKTIPCWGDVDFLTPPDGEGSVNHRTKNAAECVAAINPTGAVLDEIAAPDKCLGTVEFGEAAINLDATGVFDSSADCVSFGSVHVGSRASGNSFDAQLKDLVAPLPIELTNCAGIEITKTDDADNPLSGVTFTLHEDDNGAPGDATDQSCTTDATGVCTIEDVFIGDYWVVESNLPAGYDADGDLPYFLEITSANVNTTIELSFVNPRQRGSIVVEKTDGTNRIGGASFAIDDDGDPETTGDQTSIPGVAGQTGLFCIDNLLAGSYTVVETVVPTGYDGADPQSVAAVVPSTCAARTTVDATFVNALQPGSIEITKTDDADNPLEGVTFQLYADVAGVIGSEITGKSCTTDATGTCTISGIDAGTYWIDETNLGEDYAADADLPDQVVVAGGGATVEVDYTNPRLHRVIVLVCHQGTDTLVGSDVTIGDDTKETLDGTGLTDAEEAALCGLGGANFPGFGDEVVDAEIDIHAAP